MQFRDECLAAKITLLTSLQSGKMEEALEKVEWLHRKHPSDTTIKELKRYINFDNDMHCQYKYYWTNFVFQVKQCILL